MDWLNRLLNYFVKVLMPARFRRPALEYKVTKSIEQLADRLARPEETLAKAGEKTLVKAADRTVATLEKQQAAGEAAVAGAVSGASAAAGAAGASTGAPPALPPGPAATTQRPGWSWGQFFLWLLHFLLLALILVGLYYLNRWLGVEKFLRSDWPQLHPYWLPLLFLLLYLLGWLGLWLWELTGPDAVGWEHPDINVAWGQAVDSLTQMGIELRQTPLYLVLGQAETADSVLFEATGVPLRVRQIPRHPEAPLRVYAGPDGIYVCCPGASVLAQQAQALTRQQPISPSETSPVEGNGSSALTPAATLGPEGTTEGGDTDPWSEEERRVVGLLTAVEQPEQTRMRSGTALMRNPATVGELNHRLQHLCRLIQRDRRPYCPLNGILLLLPYAATTEEIDSSQTATAGRYDLLVIQETLQVRCPVEVVVCDMERAPGFRELLRRLPTGQPFRQLGLNFPLLPDIDEHEIPTMVQQGLQWFSDKFVPSLVYNLFRLETPATGRNPGLTESEALASNVQLYRFLEGLRQRRQRLGRLLVRALLLDMPSYYFGGVHFAGRGRTGYTLLPGVFDRLNQNQNYIAWSRFALSADARQHGWATFLYLLGVLLLVAAPIAAYIFWPF